MKKTVVSMLICLLAVLTIALSACEDNQSGENFPNSNDMKTNLEQQGYTVLVTTDLGDKAGTHLSAKKTKNSLSSIGLKI